MNTPTASIRLIINGTEYRLRPGPARKTGGPGDLSRGREVRNPLTQAGAASPASARPAAPPAGDPMVQNCQFAFSARTALVTLDVVRAVLGVDGRAVGTMVESGELKWVFNLSTQPRSQRELRFWMRELAVPDLSQIPAPQAVELMLEPGRERWKGTDLEQLLLVSRASVLRWHRAGDLPGETGERKLWFTREALAKFLLSRQWPVIAT